MRHSASYWPHKHCDAQGQQPVLASQHPTKHHCQALIRLNLPLLTTIVHLSNLKATT
jgi:hypothetical protein